MAIRGLSRGLASQAAAECGVRAFSWHGCHRFRSYERRAGRVRLAGATEGPSLVPGRWFVTLPLATRSEVSFLFTEGDVLMSKPIVTPSRRIFLSTLTLGAAAFTTRGLFAEELALA